MTRDQLGAADAGRVRTPPDDPTANGLTAAPPSEPPVRPRRSRVRRKLLRIMLIAAAILSTLLLVLVGTLFALSPGRPRPILDANGEPVPGSISEKVFLPINGVTQGMFIKSRNPSNPVLLFVHGGPGMTGYFLNDEYPTGLEDDFTVVWWDQRGTGLSYSSDIPPATMTVAQFVDDTIAVTNALRDRFKVDKIYLLGHSWGSFIGIQAVAKAPQLYHAYIGMGQVTYQLESERRSYDYLVETARGRGNTELVAKLQAAPFKMTVPLPADYANLRDEAMHTLGVGTTHRMTSVISGLFWPSWRSHDYTVQEKINIWRGKAFSASTGLSNEMLSTDLTKQVTKLDVPVYFFHGAYDYTVSRPMAKAYLDGLIAPVKGFYTFDNSAHSPAYEEPEKARRILRDDVIAGRTTLADPPDR